MGYLAKSDNQFLEVLQKAVGDPRLGIKGDPVSADQVTKAIHAFVAKPKTALKKIMATGVSTDLARITKDSFNVTVEEDNFDMGYERSFRLVPVANGQDSWQIANVENGIKFVKVQEGERIQVNKMSGTKETVYVDKYGGALGWTDEMIRFRKLSQMIDMAMAFRNKFWANKADNHYLLLAAAAAGNVTAYQGVAADGQLQRDIQTINAAAFALTNRCKDKGFGDTANARLVMYANPLNKSRINAAFRATTTALAAAGATGDVIDYNIDVVYTFNTSITAGAPLLVLPFNKIQRADVMQPTTFGPETDILSLQTVQAVWAYYGAAIGDTDQTQTVTLA